MSALRSQPSAGSQKMTGMEHAETQPDSFFMFLAGFGTLSGFFVCFLIKLYF